MTIGSELKAPPLGSVGDGVARLYEAAGIGSTSTHAVQFYEDDAFLISSVGDYLAAGLAAGQPVIAVVTASHREGISLHLAARGFEVKRATRRGQLTFLDADELLATFMEGGQVNAERSRASITAVLRPHMRTIPRATVRVFGEMVDVLCRSGYMDAAIELERQWNEMAQIHRFSLLCGYSISTFGHDWHTTKMASICEQHVHVVPTERFLDVQQNARMRDVALLQQRAKALESEIERRAELEQSLRIALSKAEAANRAKNQFLSVMSHELRTPLNAIGGHVQLVEMELLGPINDKQRESLARVQRSQRQLLGLINDVLNLARLDASQVQYAAEPVLLTEVIAEVTELVEPLFTAAALECCVECECPSELLVARADREKVRQVLLNLLGNAAKFTPAGGSVTIRPNEPGLADLVVAITVIDTGIGMPANKLSSVFEPFVQMASAAAGQKEGVGLGLSISRGLARGMGGDLVAASTPNKGSAFTLTLPRC